MFKKVLPKQGFVFTPAFDEQGQICVLIIDPQDDFMDEGSLPVPGAKSDMNRLISFFEKNDTKISSVSVTLDTHSLFHIGNAHSYTDNHDKELPEQITVYNPNEHHPKQTIKGLKTHIDLYAAKLEKQGKSHILWPLHCQLGSHGHAVYLPLFKQLKKWSNTTRTEVRYVIKGCDTKYENFSVFRSAGVDGNNYKNPNKEAFKFNIDLAQQLYKFPKLYIAGEARTHCVFDSVTDYVNWVKSRKNPNNQQIYILWDCMSDIPGFEENSKRFEEMIKNNSSFVHKVNSSGAI
jgi:nicotinamidase/pyrazinamidase